MHDPMIVAFEIRYPWPFPKRSPWPDAEPCRGLLATIWHVDPERCYPGIARDDDSCDWHGRARPQNPKEMAITEALCDLEGVIGNAPFYGSEHYFVEYGNPATGERTVHGRLGKNFENLQEAVRLWQQRDRRWWQHPRYHFWHWRIQIRPLGNLKRRLFSRCQVCRGRFAWGEVVIGTSWHGTGPRWFRGEEHVSHQACSSGGSDALPSAEPTNGKGE